MLQHDIPCVISYMNTSKLPPTVCNIALELCIKRHVGTVADFITAHVAKAVEGWSDGGPLDIEKMVADAEKTSSQAAETIVVQDSQEIHADLYFYTYIDMSTSISLSLSIYIYIYMMSISGDSASACQASTSSRSCSRVYCCQGDDMHHFM